METNKERRNKDLLATYKRLLHDGEISHRMYIKELVTTVIEQPAPSFYIEPETARNYIYRYERKIMPEGRTAKLLVEDLYGVYKELYKKFEGKYPKCELMAMAAERPAKRFYVGIETAKRIIYYS